MGMICSSSHPDDDDASANARDAQTPQVAQQSRPEIHPVFHQARAQSPMADVRRRKPHKGADQYDVVKALDDFAQKRLREDLNAPRQRSRYKPPQLLPNGGYDSLEAYAAAREQVLRFESALSFDHHCTIWASQTERDANRIVLKVRERDVKQIYEGAEPRRGYGGQMHPRFMGDHFLSNFALIEQSHLYRIIQAMPKGAHLHIHFNANLLPNVLIDIAKDMPRMFITSDIPLVGGHQGGERDAFDRCKIQFSILSEKAVESQGGAKNIFDKSYQDRQPMPFKQFLREFAERYRIAHSALSNGDTPIESQPKWADIDVDTWLRNKLVFDEEEAHNLLQTSDG